MKFLEDDAIGNRESVSLNDIVNQLHDYPIEEVPEPEVKESGDEETAIITLVNRLVVEAYNSRASDIHIEPGNQQLPTRIRLRVDGVCHSLLSVPHHYGPAIVSRLKVMCRLDIAEKRKPQDGKCVLRYRGKPLELRVATLPTVNGESAVARILSTNKLFLLSPTLFLSDGGGANSWQCSNNPTECSSQLAQLGLEKRLRFTPCSNTSTHQRRRFGPQRIR